MCCPLSFPFKIVGKGKAKKLYMHLKSKTAESTLKAVMWSWGKSKTALMIWRGKSYGPLHAPKHLFQRPCIILSPCMRNSDKNKLFVYSNETIKNWTFGQYNWKTDKPFLGKKRNWWINCDIRYLKVFTLCSCHSFPFIHKISNDGLNNQHYLKLFCNNAKQKFLTLLKYFVELQKILGDPHQNYWSWHFHRLHQGLSIKNVHKYETSYITNRF